MPDDNPIVTKYKVVNWKGQERVSNIATREEADDLAAYHDGISEGPYRVEEYKDHLYIRVRRVPDDEIGTETE